MAPCPRCGGSFFYHRVDQEWRCLLCSRPRNPPPAPLPLKPERSVYVRTGPGRKPGPVPAPDSYVTIRQAAARLGCTDNTVEARIKRRDVPTATFRKVRAVPEEWMSTLVLGAKEWRERSKASIA